MFTALFVLAFAGLFWYFFMHDVMNRLQYFERLRIYWITRDDGVRFTPVVTRAFMRQVGEPYWQGKGVQFRFGTYTFQIGLLTVKVSDLAAQLGSGFHDYSPKAIREWKGPHDDEA